MKIYRAFRDGEGKAHVVVEGGRGPKRLTPDKSLEVCNHSPTGFEFGYAGSGPAQLALAILIDYTKSKVTAIENYMDFKTEFIATAPKQGFMVMGAQIDLWLQGRVRRNA